MPKLISQKNFSNLIISGLTTSTTNQIVLHEFQKNFYRSIKYQIQITESTSYHSTEFIIMHDGNTTYNTEYGIIKTNISLASFDSDISGDTVRLLTTPSSSESTSFKIIGTAIKS